MSYENEIQHLMRELESAKSSYLNARLNSEDALMRHALKTDVETIEFQIDVFEKAAKTNEYEAKARAYDDIRYAMEMQTAIGVSDEDTLIDIDYTIRRLIESQEGGGSDD